MGGPLTEERKKATAQSMRLVRGEGHARIQGTHAILMSNPNRTDYHQLAAQLTPSERAAMTAGRNGWATPAHPAAGLGELTMMDGPLGIVSKHMDERETSTLLPSATTLAATWDPALVYRVAQVVGAEARDTETHALLGPNLGIAAVPAVRAQLRDVSPRIPGCPEPSAPRSWPGCRVRVLPPASSIWPATTPRPSGS